MHATYAQLQTQLNALALPFSLSHLHGLLCGYSCAGESPRAHACLNAILISSQASKAIKMELFSILSNIEQSLLSPDLDFQLLLPDDDATLRDRAAAFSEWCVGFLQGFASHPQKHNSETKEILKHLREFSELDRENLAVSEADEVAFMEVYEYTRIAVIALHS